MILVITVVFRAARHMIVCVVCSLCVSVIVVINRSQAKEHNRCNNKMRLINIKLKVGYRYRTTKIIENAYQ